MKKVSLILISTVLVISLGAVLLIRLVTDEHKNSNLELDKIEEKRYTTLENLLKSSSKFKDSDITANESKEIVTIDKKYDITIKNGYYMMTVKNKEEEKIYCEVVDAVEQSFGKKEGASLETCEETLKGIIEIGGIAVELYDNYKILTVNSEEAAKLYDIDNSHGAKDIISVDEINYNIKIDDYIMTSISTAFTEEAKLYNVCGHIYNANAKNDKLIFKIYDANKEEIASKEYTYKNDTKKYKTFCTEFALDLDNVKYYSIEKIS